MFTGILFVVLGAVFGGTFALPSKYVREYEWENTWAAFFLFAMLLVPMGLSSLLVTGLWQGYLMASWYTIAGILLFGCLWGAGFCCWGAGLSMVGLSLGYSVTMGTMAFVGSMMPFFLGNIGLAGTSGGMVVIAGILVCIVGVGVNGYAGMLRDKVTLQPSAANNPTSAISTLKGVIVCVLAGVLSSGCNVAFHLGSVGNVALVSMEKYGNPSWLAGLAIWNLAFLGAFLASFGYTLGRVIHRRTGGRYLSAATPRNLMLISLMALAHFACLFFYGIGAWKLGTLGLSVGFAIFQSCNVLIGNGLGFLTGEWGGSTPNSRAWLGIGLAILITGIIIVAVGNAMIQPS